LILAVILLHPSQNLETESFSDSLQSGKGELAGFSNDFIRAHSLSLLRRSLFLGASRQLKNKANMRYSAKRPKQRSKRFMLLTPKRA
jgi:hypothetical protein